MRTHRLVLVSIALLAAASGSTAQDPGTPGQPVDPVAADVTKSVGSPRLAIRIAAARKVAGAGDAAVPALRAHVAKSGANSLPLTLVEALVEDGGNGPGLTALLREWTLDRDFYWRAQCLRGLALRADTNRTEDVAVFTAAKQDPAWLARANAALGLARTGSFDEGGQPAWRSLLSDPDPRVPSRVAALVLPLAPEQDVLQELLDALGDTRTFLGDPWGNRRCTEALAALKQWAADTSLEPRPLTTPPQTVAWSAGAGLAGNRAAIDTLLATARRRTGAILREPVELRDPETAFDGGIEVFSCRNGDLFLRWTDSGTVAAGIEGDKRVQLPAEAWDALRTRLQQTTLAAENGTVVCDRMRLAHSATRTQHAVAPGSMPAPEAQWVLDLAGQLEQAGARELAVALRDRLQQFAAP